MSSSNVSLFAAVGLLAICATGAWLSRPFPDLVDLRTVPIHNLTPFQKVNLQHAAEKLNNQVIEPGEKFSFNKVVGARIEGRGYLPSKSFIDGQTVDTTGGGICVVSSYLYQLALETGMRIDQRTAHMRAVRSVSPGLDATVWFGQADLAFTNTTNSAVKLRTLCDPNNFTIEFLGNKKSLPLCEVHAQTIRKNGDTSVVSVTRVVGGKPQAVSTDTYRLN